jgi:hypothetical protein
VILILGIAVLAVMLGLSVGLAVCASILARRSDEAVEDAVLEALAPVPLADEPALTTRRFARDPDGRPIAAPRREPPRTPSVARG